MVSIYPSTEKIPNYRHIYIPIDDEQNSILENLKSNIVTGASNNSIPSVGILLPKMLFTINEATANILVHPKMERLKTQETFDLIVFGLFVNEFVFGLAGHFQCPYVVVTATPAFKIIRDYVGNPIGWPYTSAPMLDFKGHMTFFQRLKNYGCTIFETIFAKFMIYFITEPYYAKTFPPSKNYPSFEEVKKNISLILVTQHFSQSTPMALLPNVIEVSGMHIKSKPDPLPEVSKFILFINIMMLIEHFC